MATAPISVHARDAGDPVRPAPEVLARTAQSDYEEEQELDLSHPWNPDRERFLAYRVVLTALVLDPMRDRQPLPPPDLEERYGRTLAAMAKCGRPTSQVKALWA